MAKRSDALSMVRRLCLALPESTEVEAWGEPTFRVRNKIFAMFASASSHHGAGRTAIWCKAPPGNQELMVRDRPDRYFVPPYVGPSGWIGVVLNSRTSWKVVAEHLGDAYRMTAGKRLSARMS